MVNIGRLGVGPVDAAIVFRNCCILLKRAHVKNFKAKFGHLIEKQFLCTSKDGTNRRWLAPDGCTFLEERKYTPL